MAIIQDRDKPLIEKRLALLKEPVTLVNFTQELECQFCHETHQLLEELSGLSEKIRLEVYDFIKDQDEVKAYRIDKIPATVLVGDKDRGIRYFGVPAGYEFATLLDDMVMVSAGDSGLTSGSREKLESLEQPVHIEVLITPT
jgi:glutaredoxin-like protein